MDNVEPSPLDLIGDIIYYADKLTVAAYAARILLTEDSEHTDSDGDA